MLSLIVQQLLKKPLFFIVLYTIIFAAIFILCKVDPGGPCSPGDGLLLLLLFILLSFIGLLVSLFKVLRSGSKDFALTIIHLLFCIALILYFMLG